MRKLLPLLIGAVLSYAPLSQAATPEDTLVVALSLDGIISFDPAESFETVSTSSLVDLYQGLVAEDRQDSRKLSPALASSWKPGNTEHSLIFTLKTDAQFASGNPVTVHDVIYSLTRAVKLNKTPVFILGELGWTPENIDAQFTQLSNNELEIRWISPIGHDLALRLLSAPVALVVDSKEVEKNAQNNDFGNGWLRTRSAGSGAYTLRNYVPQQAVVLEQNPHAQPAPLLKRVLLKGVAEAGSRRLLLEQGDVDVAYDLGADQFDALKTNANVQVKTFPSSLIYYLGFNTKDKTQPVLGNPALWEAARWLVDYEGIANQLLKGQFEVRQTFLPKGFDGALDTTPFRLDVDKAKSILQKAGIKPGTRFSVTIINQPPYTDIAQALQASFAKADIDLQIQPVTEADLWSKMRGRNFQSIFIYWGADYVDPNTNASTFAYNVPDGPKTLAWRVGWDIPELSKETRAAAAAGTSQQRSALYEKLQKTVQDSSPYVVTLQDHRLVALRKNIHGAHQGLGTYLLYFDQVSKK
ncbi:ABC transporter substrate-binding protein [Pectobacterium polonicum]|uniref:ABC transporter substrate-binding protein n=2 Tax=Pectobacterium polonicum TaxID=2485124 RepID=A0AAE9SX24_9GAMM|nr:ABC transporter substrate-binding protein [Pectobacterium polonicum]UVO08108.1 ABC transporter substrate-binding protein [Pectobacterium polonicum]GKW25743.1 ABC transporter substrate-binding protein [Pectobacterium carotovorum subsp. carotovorum]